MLILFLISIGLLFMVFSIATVDNLYRNTVSEIDDINPGASVVSSGGLERLGEAEKLFALIEAAKEKSETPFYSGSVEYKISIIAHRTSKIERDINKIKLKIFVCGCFITATGIGLGIWSAVETLR